MEKHYNKPTATHIVFYSEEEITKEIALPSIYAFGDDDDIGIGDSDGSTEAPPDWGV